MNADTIVHLIEGLMVAAVVGLVYHEMRKRQEAQVEADLAKRQGALNADQAKLDENETKYDEALGELPHIDPDMLEHIAVAQPGGLNVTDLNGGKPVTVSSVGSGNETGPEPHTGTEGQAPTVH